MSVLICHLHLNGKQRERSWKKTDTFAFLWEGGLICCSETWRENDARGQCENVLLWAMLMNRFPSGESYRRLTRSHAAGSRETCSCGVMNTLKSAEITFGAWTPRLLSLIVSGLYNLENKHFRIFFFFYNVEETGKNDSLRLYGY